MRHRAKLAESGCFEIVLIGNANFLIFMKTSRFPLLHLSLLLSAAFVSKPLAAQDVTCQPAVLFDTSDKPDAPPTPDDLDIEYPAALAKAGTQGYAIAAFVTPRLESVRADSMPACYRHGHKNREQRARQDDQPMVY
jgi:hypothetical protein